MHGPFHSRSVSAGTHAPIVVDEDIMGYQQRYEFNHSHARMILPFPWKQLPLKRWKFYYQWGTRNPFSRSFAISFSSFAGHSTVALYEALRISLGSIAFARPVFDKTIGTPQPRKNFGLCKIESFNALLVVDSVQDSYPVWTALWNSQWSGYKVTASKYSRVVLDSHGQ